MTRAALLATCVLATLWGGCGSDGPGASQAGVEEVDSEDLLITVSGQAAVFPEAAQYLRARSIDLPALDGLPVRIEEPLRVAVNDPDAPLATGSLATDGAYRVSEVPVRNVLLSLGAGVGDGSFSGNLMHTSTIVFDTALTQTRPRRDLVDTRAYVLPMRYVQALSYLVGEPRIRALSNGLLADLQETGFVLGRVVDAAGMPVAGARISAVDRPDLAGHVFYPSGDAGTLGTEATDASGLFLYVHSGGNVETFRLAVEGAAGTYVPRNAGAARGLGVLMMISPKT
ncbi:carboxypeptidase regulatory-like domain-containing protein [Aggregicoccus sp. 17bor-14]|uniref:carboxypeptidase regulatory-like domain-containing protein n=1 Tax=Myxococcaceae TaxID=31 RepID=UPI00129D1604|nr:MULTISPECIES: carboxypeptidase regulatory-like domain-containing protein [Myxococcaceae]MBF5046304.1 carboxypeptidase regulatory-like domain-containing protein [Simulacricoccus sp. 17bor-14]MRI92026.1 carboxypeptidase regulatory-like domain-containing protein [Aggregicoccus sp. 17bor-14]